MKFTRLSKLFSKCLSALILACFSLPAWAADVVPWKSYLFVVMTISLAIGLYLGLRNKKADSTSAKLLLSGVYFWVLTFAQLTLLSLLYYFTK